MGVNFTPNCYLVISDAIYMGKATLLSLLFLLLIAVVEVWIFTVETNNRRVKALRLHVFALQELVTSLICQLKKLYSGENLTFLYTMYSQERSVWLHKMCTAILVWNNSGLLVSTKTS